MAILLTFLNDLIPRITRGKSVNNVEELSNTEMLSKGKKSNFFQLKCIGKFIRLKFQKNILLFNYYVDFHIAGVLGACFKVLLIRDAL